MRGKNKGKERIKLVRKGVLTLFLPSLPIRMASAKDEAPMGKIMNSCIASLLPAWLPPLITFKAGTGITSSLVPARCWMCLYKGMPCAPAPALHRLRETPRIAFAPSFSLLGVPSNSIMRLSTSFCSLWPSSHKEYLLFERNITEFRDVKWNLQRIWLFERNTAEFRDVKKIESHALKSIAFRKQAILLLHWVTKETNFACYQRTRACIRKNRGFCF